MAAFLTDVDAVHHLRKLQTVRERCALVYAAAEAGSLNHFALDTSRFDAVVEFVLKVIRDAYPTLDVPFHSRWRHFEVGGVDRVRAYAEKHWVACDALEVARRKLDLAVVSVLLDAGAGSKWWYTEPAADGASGRYWRSEGLAVASWHMFVDGLFSSAAGTDAACRVDAAALLALTELQLITAFQVSPENPMLGLTGRFELLKSLGRVLEQDTKYFQGPHDAAPRRPGNMVDYLMSQSVEGADGRRHLAVETLWEVVIEGMRHVWPDSRSKLGGHNLGDCWHHPAAVDDARFGITSGWVVFHKLSQWLAYSLMEPLQDLGLVLDGLEHMTGLPEYRNGGLLVDLGVLVPKHDAVKRDAHAPDSELVVEWRALTVCCLDELGARIRAQLDMTPEQLPLVKVLQGGTWTAGRLIAAQLRGEAMEPPITIISDGTVF